MRLLVLGPLATVLLLGCEGARPAGAARPAKQPGKAGHEPETAKRESLDVLPRSPESPGAPASTEQPAQPSKVSPRQLSAPDPYAVQAEADKALSLTEMVQDSDWVVVARIDKATQAYVGRMWVVSAEFTASRQVKGDFPLPSGRIRRDRPIGCNVGESRILFDRITELREGTTYLLFLNAFGKIGEEDPSVLRFQLRFEGYDLRKIRSGSLCPKLAGSQDMDAAASRVEELLRQDDAPYIGGLLKRIFEKSHIVVLGSVSGMGKYDVGYSRYRLIVQVERYFKKTISWPPEHEEKLTLMYHKRLQEAEATAIPVGCRLVAFLGGSRPAVTHHVMDGPPIWILVEVGGATRLRREMLGYGTNAQELLRALHRLSSSRLAMTNFDGWDYPPESMFGQED